MQRYIRTPILACLSLLLAGAWTVPALGGGPAKQQGYLALVRSHLDKLVRHSVDAYGPDQTRMWLATIDTGTGGLPEPPLPSKLRWYRKITSPAGSNLYWDQPTILAAYALSEHAGDARYGAAADAYIPDFLARCVAAESGLFQWGNHVYYDVVRDEVSPFSGGYHECRPHTPAWETFWKHDPRKTEAAIRAMGLAHVRDKATGLFCRHANPNVAPRKASQGKNAMPFLEAGATLIDSLCWLAKQTGDPDGELAELALRVARYSFAHRDPSTGLVRNQPVVKRWDYFASTTEVGLWAGSLDRAARYTGNQEFRRMAVAALRPWLRLGFDEKAGKFYGRLAVETGLAQAPEQPRGWIPPVYAEVFDIHERPTHNYPMPMAETCLNLYEATGDPRFRQGAERFAAQVRASLPANGGRGAYAEDYGRVIHFLVRASKVIERPKYRTLARQVADEAVDRLYVAEHGMFRSHPGENRCDAVDGPGVLLLGLLYLETGKDVESAFAF